MSGIQISGLLSNSAFDWKSVVDQLMEVSAVPITKLQAEQETNDAEAEALTTLGAAMTELQDAAQAIRGDEIFASRTVTSDVDNSTWKCSSVIGSEIGSYTFDVTQLATKAKLVGASDICGGLASSLGSPAVVGLALNNLPLSPVMTAGSFTVNGASVTVALTDSLQDVFDAISAATSGSVTGSYDSATDKVTLAGATSLADGTSNFGAALKLADAGGGSYVSLSATGAKNAAQLESLTLANLTTSTAVTAGTFTVAGEQVTITTADSLRDVFDKIASATNGSVTATYNSSTDKVSLVDTSLSTELVLGAANDTSNFLAVMKLANNSAVPSKTITSSGALGTLKPAATLANAGLRTAITAVVGGVGSFSINGVAISYNVNTDTVYSVIGRINDAGAGVVAAYDSANDRVVLTNKITGDVGLSVEESAGGILGALGLTTAGGGTLERGKNALFTVNGSSEELSSTSNTLDAAVHGITGLSVTVNTMTAQTLQVESDTISMQTALQTFIEKFNAVQDTIDSLTTVTVSGTNVTTAVLSDNREVQTWADQLRSLVFDSVSGVTGDISRLDHIGIDFDGTTSHLKIKDSGKLATALGDTPDEVEALFLDSTDGIVTRLYTYLTQTASLKNSQISHLAEANTDLDEQIATLQARLDAEREQLTNSFIQMLDAQSAAQSQSTYLTNTFFKNNSSS